MISIPKIIENADRICISKSIPPTAESVSSKASVMTKLIYPTISVHGIIIPSAAMRASTLYPVFSGSCISEFLLKIFVRERMPIVLDLLVLLLFKKPYSCPTIPMNIASRSSPGCLAFRSSTVP